MRRYVTESPGWWEGVWKAALNMVSEPRTECTGVHKAATGAPVIAQAYRILLYAPRPRP